MIKLILACILSLLYAYAACAQDNANGLSMRAMRAMVSASTTYNIDVLDLAKIGYVESKWKQAAKRVNKNGTIDIGMFQINSVHWYKECKGMQVKTLEGNANCAAKLIAGHAKWSSIDKQWLARYHSKTKAKKRHYAKLLAKAGNI